MEEINNAIETLKQIEMAFGIGGLFLFLLLVLVSILLYRYLIRKVERVAEEASEKSIVKFQAIINDQLETKIRLFFRNEEIRNQITKHFAVKSIESKLAIWTETYQLYFDYQKTWNLDKEQLDDSIDEYDKKFQKNRESIFLNSIFLGGFLTSKLITLNNSMRNALRTQLRYNHLAFPEESGARTELEKNRYMKRIDQILPEVEAWIGANLLVDHNTKMWEFTEEELRIIAEQKNQKFEDIASLRNN